MNEAKKSFVPGIVLIVIGALILFHKLDIFHFYWSDIYPIVFLLLGIWFFIGVFAKGQKGLAFPGTLFLLLGLFFLLRNNYFHYRLYFDDFWPIFLIIFGLAFVVQFIFNIKDWGLLIPGGIFLFLGFGFLARTMDWYIPFEFEYYIGKYWPVALILIGIAIIVSSIKKKEK